MDRKQIIEKLKERGYMAEEDDVIKNGVKIEGICIFNESPVTPVIYTEEIIAWAEKNKKGIDSVADKVIRLYEKNKKAKFDIEKLSDLEWVKTRLRVELQKKSTEELVKKDCEELEGIESYLVVRCVDSGTQNYSIKLTMPLLNFIGISEEEAWKQAEENTNGETVIENIFSVISRLIGQNVEAPEFCKELYIISNRTQVKGASAILNKEVLKKFGEEHNIEKIVVMPSSIHEMIIAPFESDENIEDFSQMVAEINCKEVDPKERLTNRAYILTV